MGDQPSPQVIPPPPPSIMKPDLHMLYYGLVVVGTAVVVLALYNLIVIRWRVDHRSRNRWPHRVIGSGTSQSSQSVDMSFLYSFKYKKGGGSTTQDEGNDPECAVCLSVFEESEELRQLPNCKHSFHASCIDMWLYSHMDCPLCRSSVLPAFIRQHLIYQQQPEEHSREVLLREPSPV